MSPHLLTQLQAVPVLPFVYPSLISFSSFTIPGAPYRIFLPFLPWLPCHFNFVVNVLKHKTVSVLHSLHLHLTCFSSFTFPGASCWDSFPCISSLASYPYLQLLWSTKNNNFANIFWGSFEWFCFGSVRIENKPYELKWKSFILV